MLADVTTARSYAPLSNAACASTKACSSRGRRLGSCTKAKRLAGGASVFGDAALPHLRQRCLRLPEHTHDAFDNCADPGLAAGRVRRCGGIWDLQQEGFAVSARRPMFFTAPRQLADGRRALPLPGPHRVQLGRARLDGKRPLEVEPVAEEMAQPVLEGRDLLAKALIHQTVPFA